MKTTIILPIAIGFLPLAPVSQHTFGQNQQPSLMPEQQQQTLPILADDAKAKRRQHSALPDARLQRLFWGIDALTEPERQKLRAAIDKANNDTKVVRLRESADNIRDQLRRAMREAILRADPTLEPVLTKMRESTKRKWQEGAWRRDCQLGNRLPEEIRQRLDAAHEKAKTYPLVTAAKAKLEAAKTPQECSAAARELRAAYRKVILNLDPTLAPYLKPSDWRGGKHGRNWPREKATPFQPETTPPVSPPIQPE